MEPVDKKRGAVSEADAGASPLLGFLDSIFGLEPDDPKHSGVGGALCRVVRELLFAFNSRISPPILKLYLTVMRPVSVLVVE